MIGYLDCFAGASGDMILGALIDAGASPQAINDRLAKLGDIYIACSEVSKLGIRATKIEVKGSAPLGTYGEAAQMLKEDPRALSVITLLAQAEAKVHGLKIDDVHFHEISLADTIGDIVGVCAALDDLDIDELLVSTVRTGYGMVQTQHGHLPIPAPATAELLRGFVAEQGDVASELVTPTGAAIIASFAKSVASMPPINIEAIGYGAGTKDLDIPNVVRLVLGRSALNPFEQRADLQIEANIDDMNPQFYEYISDRLFDSGALDVWVTPTIGKRGRPSQTLAVIAPTSAESSVREVLIAETSTLGVRITPVRRWMVDREWKTVDVLDHPVRIKVGRHGGRIVNVAPEYSDCAEIAQKTGTPLKEVFRLALAEYDSEKAAAPEDPGRAGRGRERI